jgi:outer membrane lipoprotein carrier protein
MKSIFKSFLLSHSILLPATISILALSLLFSFDAHSLETSSIDDNRLTIISEQVTNNTVLIPNKAKHALMVKLNDIHYINAKFSQVVVNEEGDVLQEGYGTLAISKPNLVNWHTTAPDETLIISDGKDLWFYDPFIDQVSLYSFNKSIANTPVLLLTSQDPTLWSNYQVSQYQNDSYLIQSLDVSSQVKSLEIGFNGGQLSKLSLEDSTGQVSHISLIDVDFITQPKASLFKFVVLEGITVDDQR